MTAAVSFERCDEDRYVLRFAYDPVLVSVVKAVPWRERDYDERRRPTGVAVWSGQHLAHHPRWTLSPPRRGSSRSADGT